MPNINLDDAYILDETGAQVDKVTGLFTKDEETTEEEKAFAQLNIGASGGGGGGGRNLLDNPFFTVRQRGDGPWTTAVYTADRWKNTGANQSTTLTSQGLVIQQVNNGYDGVEQKLPADLSAALVGSALTLSINCLAVSGTYRYRMRFFNGSSLISAKFGGITSAGLYSVTMDEVPANTNLIVVDFFTNSGTAGDTITVAAIKLEKGTVSTLANDAPPNDAEELMKCNFYDIMLKTSAQYGYLGYGIADSATSTTILIPLPNNMRDATPTITTGGTIAVKGGTSGTHTITGITFKLRVTGGVLVTVTTAGLTTGEFCLLQLSNTSSYINLSADL